MGVTRKTGKRWKILFGAQLLEGFSEMGAESFGGFLAQGVTGRKVAKVSFAVASHHAYRCSQTATGDCWTLMPFIQ